MKVRDALHLSRRCRHSRSSLGDFQLVREIGSGGMGIVCEAIDTRESRRAKRIRQESSPTAKNNVSQGTRPALQRIVQLHEVGEHEGNPISCWNTWTEAASTPSSPARRSIPTRRQLLATLARQCSMYEQGIVHRDLKPANILLKDEGGRMKDEKTYQVHPSSFIPHLI